MIVGTVGKYCTWKYDVMDDFYETECDESFFLTTGNLKDNHIKYCPYCGKRIEELPDEKS
jgi:hypothetical protein